jgi:hypothetical protein
MAWLCFPVHAPCFISKQQAIELLHASFDKMNGAFKEKYWLQWNRCHGAAPDFILAQQPPGRLLRLLKMYDIAYAKRILLLGKNWFIGKRAVRDRQKAMLAAGIFLYGAPVALQQFAGLSRDH